jgi:D-arabinose 1-dehydrogenase-like Zn-dependent alcohol dehydrogenase
LCAVPPDARDAWLDEYLGVEDTLPADGRLEPGTVPYMPCAVSTLLAAIEHGAITPRDVFVDIGCGWGRAMAFVHLMTGAEAIGVEVQPHLASRARRLNAPLTVIEGDATEIVRSLRTGTVFFLYCPFSGDRLRRVMDDLESIAREHPIRVCAVDLPLPPCAWLEPVHARAELAIWRSK